jgi:DNA-binding XRE family transcriptional regulator
MTSGTSDNFYVAPEQERAFIRLFKDARELRGWSQMRASQESGVGQKTISEIERGPYRGMAVWDVAKLARAYGISMNEVVNTLGWGLVDNSVAPEVEQKIRIICKAMERLEGEDLDALVRIVEGFLKGAGR